MIPLRNHAAAFWNQNPALLYGLAALLGSTLALYSLWPPIFFLLFLILFLPALSFQKTARHLQMRAVFSIALVIVCFIFSQARYQLPTKTEKSIPGIALVDLSTISTSHTPFGSQWVYKGTLKSFTSADNQMARNIPIKISIPKDPNSPRPSADHQYLIEGKLKMSGTGKYYLTPKKNTPWNPVQDSLNLAEWRYSAKNNVQQQIQQSISNTHVASFLSGMATGEYDDIHLASELGRFGLLHLMAISGLHFSILASILGFMLSLVFSRKIAAIAVILLLSGYFIFLGSSPSIIRAWIAIVIAFSGILLRKQTSALNSLGLALLFVCLWDPLLINNIAFQFSFAITAAILIWYPSCDSFLQRIFSKRSLGQMVHLGWLEQHAYCLLVFLRKTLALTIAVNLVAFPLTLYHFYKFPVMGLIYNLFFPFLVSFSMLLLLLALIFSPVIPFLAQGLHSLNSSYTQFLLNFTFNLPKSFDSMIRINALPLELLLVYLSGIFFLGIVFKSLETNEEMI